MSATIAHDLSSIPPVSHREARTLAETAYRRFADELATVPDEGWAAPTDCSEWTVRDLAGHVVGAMRSAASVRELMSQQREVARRVKATGRQGVAVMTALQVELTASLSPAELVAECAALVGPATAGRDKTPAVLRKLVRLRVQMDDIDERWALGYLIDVVLTRDAWLHRIDLCRALGREPELTAEHDGRIVADVVAEWARRHGTDVHLTLTGPAGGVFGAPGADRAHLEIDAVEFCRTVSGRIPGTGLLAEPVPF